MSQTALLVNMFPVAGVSQSITPGLKTAWVRGFAAVTLGEAVAPYSLSNAELLASVKCFRPPHSWYEEDHEGLYWDNRSPPCQN
jgi:hypothetical protein